MERSLEQKVYYAYKSAENSSDLELYDVLNKIIKVKMASKNVKFEELSPLFLEVIIGNRDAVLKLIETGADVNEVRRDGLTPLAAAVLAGDFFMAQQLLIGGANVNGTEEFNPLIIACSRNDARMLNLLANYDASMNVVDKNGFNGLHHLFNNFLIDSLKVPVCPYVYFGTYQSADFNVGYDRNIDEIIKCIRILSLNGIDMNYARKVLIKNNGCKFVIPVNPLSLALETQPMRVIDCLEECGTKMEAFEINPSMIYAYQRDFKQNDMYSWINSFSEYKRYLDYKRKIKAYNIEVISVFDNDNYKRPKMIKKILD